MSEEGFLSRWSRRKRAVEAGLPVAEPVIETPPDGMPPDSPPPVPEEPPFDITTLPTIESLTSASDFTAFLRKEVPEALKRAALRKAWALDPAIRDFVGPADYAWDYNAPDGVPGGSLDLVGDVREMLAQVFGPEPLPGGAAPEATLGDVAGVAPEGAPRHGVPEGAPGHGVPVGAPGHGVPVGAPGHGAPEGAPGHGAPEGAPMLPPSLLAEATAPVADLSATDADPAEPPLRRHGSALPS